jgi:hypothetical protein
MFWARDGYNHWHVRDAEGYELHPLRSTTGSWLEVASLPGQ